MKEIHVLDNNLINKIAAGEVVERPSSVVKELVENSIDAGATAITVEIKDGGINYIRITDNGRGIPKEQLKTAFMRHATSKLESFEDLENILTLGFRGEALSSIASVSQVEMITKTAESETGRRIEIHGGSILSEEDTACVEGTTFIVRNLFYNTPARRKFLKKPSTEGSNVSDIVNKIALGHPHISFKYINNNSVILHTSGNNDIKTTVFHVYGKEVAKKTIPLEYKENSFELSGLIGKPEMNRANRSYENFFINGRYIKSSLVQSAVEEAYKGKLMLSRFPVFIINMTVPANTVDVNVHPTKLEVRFSDENFIFDMIYAAVSKALKQENLIPSLEWEKKSFSEVTNTKPLKAEKEQKDISSLLYSDKEENIKNTDELIKIENEIFSEPLLLNEELLLVPEEKKVEKLSDRIYNNDYIQLKEKSIEKENIKEENLQKEKTENKKAKEYTKQAEKAFKPFFYNYKIIGQIFDTYWIIEQNGSMYMIDQHAAHERILYEELTQKMKNNEPVSQRLLQPVAVDLTPKEMQTVKENFELFEKFGFELESFGERTYAVRAVPFIFKAPESAGLFMDIVDTLTEKDISSIYETKLDDIATMACKAAVKGNDRLNYVEAKSLIEKLVKLENPFTCPHGRPTVIEISKNELEKKFKRRDV